MTSEGGARVHSKEDALYPINSEGSYLLHKVPVVHTEKTVGSTEVAQIAALVLATAPMLVLYIVMQRHFVNSLAGFSKG